MSKSKISIIIGREYASRVKKKSFILTTILTPILFAALMIVPGLIAVYSGSDSTIIKVADNSGIVMPYLENTDKIIFEQIPNATSEEIKDNFKSFDANAVLYISPLDTLKDASVIAYAERQINIESQSHIKKCIRKALEDNKLKDYNIPNIDQILNSVKTDVNIKTYEISEDGNEKESKVEIYMIIGYVASFMIYMFVFMFGSMVMRSVIEEKSTRIVEVIVSSVKPFQLMMGKIIGVAAVALTQFFIWILLTVGIIFVAGNVIGLDKIVKEGATTQVAAIPADAGGSVEQIMNIQDDEEGGAASFIRALKEINYVKIIFVFIIYFTLGYLLYSSMFAAVGAAVDNEADTQQLILPVTLPLIIGLFIMLHTFQNPDSALSFWGSIIPFTSPMVMMARISYGVPTWELLLSIGLLLITFVGIAYLSAKIYRTGILMYGKKPGWKDLFKWMKGK